MSATSAREFEQLTEPHRHELRVHCYRMTGSVHEADDLVQETFLRAWRAYDRYDPTRASLRTWLYRIATNACLNARNSRQRRALPSGVGERFDDPEADFVPGFEVPWLEPFPLDPRDPAITVEERSQLRLALVAALQLLPARQRAALILCEVLDLPAAGVAEVLGASTASVNSALQRARATLAKAGVDPERQTDPPDEQRAVVDRYVAAFERGDVGAITALLADDVVLEMPPMWNWYAGPSAYGGFMKHVFRRRGTDWHSEPLWANGEAGFVAYLADDLHTVQILTTVEGRVARTTVYQDPTVFALFGLPRQDEDERPMS